MRIGLPCKEAYLFVFPEDIIYIESIHNNCLVYSTVQPAPFIASIGIQEVSRIIPGDLFCRVHKSYIVCLDHVLKMNKIKTRVYYQENKTLPIGRRYLNEFLLKAPIIR